MCSSDLREVIVAKEFRGFVMRRDIISITVGLVIALAFVTLANSFVNNIQMQIVAAIFSETSFDRLDFDPEDATIFYINS